ncbi:MULTISPECIES: GntR family transcriptional regulator [Mangrovibacter]|uniref:GntR family transcriptional regulator n=1 Tax=Mangrovibacter plantisponsor TaxID=451513 RepID=A0A317Q5L2_9ENTR|nr:MULTISPECIES: GntR family transcriptional regulator [Mangrovibacter]KEA51107.1 GntR family transcriptional regulator [Mangrovibacter sp. MFB070]PWW10923.1 GntR family transcriptional regulator [Mangrovibacter plantisponsor]
MSRTQNLRHNVINQFIESLVRGHLASPLPSQNALADMFNISRTTVRHILEHLVLRQVLVVEQGQYIIARMPLEEDGYQQTRVPAEAQQRIFERTFYHMINQRQLRAGDQFTEVELAKQAGVSPIVVREFLLKFSRYSLTESERRGTWRMKVFDKAWAEQLFELREMLETHSLQRFMNLPADNPSWLQARDLLARHRTMRGTIGDNYRMFAELDRDFHALLLSAANNIFFNQSLEIISVIFHFHYQWDESDLKQRNIVAVDEHMTILSAMICGDDLAASRALRNHLNTAKVNMIASLQPVN